MVRRVSGIAAFVALAMLPARAGVLNIYGSSAPTVDLPGYTTYTLSVETDVAEIQGFDFLGGEAVGDYGFFGSMNQVNPHGMPTIFSDFNGVMPFVGQTSARDTQFLFSSSDLLSIRTSESASELRGAFATFQPIGKAFSFAQIVVPDTQQVSFRGALAYTSERTDLEAQEFSGHVGQGLLFSKEVLPLPPPQIDFPEVVPVVPPEVIPVAPPVAPPIAPLVTERVGKFSIVGSSMATPGLAGHTTYTLSLQTDVASVGGLDFVGGPDAGNFGFFGPMHQSNLGDVGTVFSDHNAAIDALGGNSKQDSQFLFDSTNVLSILANESDGNLQAAFAGFEPLGTSFDFAQIVVPDGQEVIFRGKLGYSPSEIDLPAQDLTGIVSTGVLYEADVLRPVVEIIPEPEPVPTPLPPPVMPTPPDAQPEPAPGIIVISDPDGPHGELPFGPVPGDLTFPEDPGFVVFPIIDRGEWGRPGWISFPEGIVGEPYIIDHTELPPGVITLVDAPIAFDSDDVPLVYLFTRDAGSYAVALNAAGSAYLLGQSANQIPEPATWCQALFILTGILSLARRAR